MGRSREFRQKTFIAYCPLCNVNSACGIIVQNYIGSGKYEIGFILPGPWILF